MKLLIVVVKANFIAHKGERFNIVNAINERNIYKKDTNINENDYDVKGFFVVHIFWFILSNRGI